jgi:ABC-2 type transport system ATP-binding protein
VNPSRQFEADQVTFRYGKKVALHEVSFELRVGATVLLGRNGAGKSTLIATLVGAPVRLPGGCSWTIGWSMPVAVAVAQFCGRSAGCRSRSVTGAAISLAGLTDQAGHGLRSLSGGQLRRAGLAAAIVALSGWARCACWRRPARC